MLPSDLLRYRRRGGSIYPRYLRQDQRHWAATVLETLTAHRNKTRGELMQALRALEGDSPDYRVVRGLAHLALQASEFGLPLSEPEPEALRHEAFTLAAQRGYGERQRDQMLHELAGQYQLEPALIQAQLYADLPERHLLSAVTDSTPEQLADRYDLAQAQGLLYSALNMQVIAHRNVPGEYRRLFHRLKFHGLLYAVEGNLDDGYQIYIDGPASLFKQTRKYGINMACFLPALLQISRWEMRAELAQQDRKLEFTLDSDSPLRSHAPAPPPYDSLLERSFAERWEKLKTPWQLEREVEIVDLTGTVFVPDFALRHPDGRTVHIEIVGFWHPDYLRRKLDKVRRAAMPDLLLAVSDRLNVSTEQIAELAGPVIWFKGKLDPRQVLAVIER